MEGNRLKQKAPPKSGVITSLKGYFTNFSFGFQGLLTHKTLNVTPKDIIVFSGKTCSSVDQAAELQQYLPWFTYRKNSAIGQGFSSDVGWGCMIRVAQMALAAAIIRFSQAKGLSLDRPCIIGAFQEGGKYSLLEFLERGKTLFLKGPGLWFSVREAADLLECLHCSRPLRGTEELKVMAGCQVFSLPQAQRLLRGHNSKFQFQREKKEKKETPRGLLLVMTVHLTEVSQQSYGWILEVMSWPWTLGCLGGKPKEARFLTGRYNSELSYLDPHYVQEQIKRQDLSKHLGTFSCKEYRLMGMQNLDPSLAFCFYLNSEEELLALGKKVEEKKMPILGVSYEEEREEKPKVCEEVSEENYRPSMECSFLMD